MSECGREILKQRNIPLPQMDLFPTGSQYISSYLEHLERYLQDSGKCQIHLNCEVLSIGRSSFLKREHINSSKRKGATFRALIYNSAENKERFIEDVQFLVDCSGTWNQPNHAGIGGIPALGETRMISSGLIRQHIPNKERDAKLFLGKTVALIGSGASAITSLNALSSMANQGEDVEVVWIVRRGGEPYSRVADDPLPQRDLLYSKGNEISRGNHQVLGGRVKVSYLQCANVLEFQEKELGAGKKVSISLSIQISNCGFRPNTSIWDELQVHQCYASSGPMKLAAALLSAGGGGGDCLSQSSHGPETLCSPEPGFFVLGMKSYGRSSAFLLKIGHEQVRDVMTLIDKQAKEIVQTGG
ncbi:hypothetical protein GUITHDRAFT_114893 [Guillardia theta CCMP2712]|uniref:L-ornithine N(5)-oxygenase n=1 Tax=Guillardia theta (strain CCMP2712) TaxID=905079 RepID=L1IT49_GUITC|nr:hypothetical protein GUITHDRAFT_114893 [Guillardia theta CCMP2712]EKX39015.1 hypothetical protein GUITHDRAFT_114893 [Guillardia theta CCMP2712]|eukprot:XP_005825995.1 hypothetical protein GUITHDRAFT_114893 [Guillardia theta CCMP2712]